MSASIASIRANFGQWTPTASIATPTQITSVGTSLASSLASVVRSASMAVATETDFDSLRKLSRTMRGALASLTVINAEKYLATATATSDFPLVTNAIMDATINLKALYVQTNPYRAELKWAPNIVYTVVFGMLLLSQIGLFAWSRSWYFAVCFICATALEFIGYLTRTLAIGNELDQTLFVCQIVCLTIAPAFVMAGIYFLLAQLVILSGPRSSAMKPMWFSYIFIGCDVVSLLAQAAGGGISAGDSPNSGKIGSNVALAGIVFQVATMSVFAILLLDYFNRSFFKFESSAPRTAKAFFQILFATKTGRAYRRELDASYDPQFKEQRNVHPDLYGYLPLAMVCGWLLVFIRCIYRVVELAEGVNGYLYKTEVFVMVLDALMIALTCALFIVFHPAVVFGKNNGLSAKAMRKQTKASRGTNEVSESVSFNALTVASLSDEFENEKAAVR